MHYLIDGHNLIAKHPHIELSDPHDEMKLVLRLKSWTAVSRKRHVTVIFDKGMPGGRANFLSSNRVTVVFAPQTTRADALLITRIQKVHHPPEYTLVSSDREIVEVAQKRRMPNMTSEEFVKLLEPETTLPPEPAKPSEPLVSDSHVDEWLQIFGDTPTRKPRTTAELRRLTQPPPLKPPRSKSKDKPKKAAPPPEPTPLHEAKDGGRMLTETEVDEWLTLFGGEPEIAPLAVRQQEKRQATKKASKKFAKKLRVSKSEHVELSDDEVSAWLSIFGNNT